jgi:peptidoglycan-N-acetylglucosamine deacetylase
MKLCRADKVLLGGGATMLGGALVFGASPLVFAAPALFAAVIADGVARPSSSIFYPTISHGARDRDAVALTFDDGPDPQVTPGVLDTLAEFGAHATFFTIGRNLERNVALGQRIVAEGHELGNHSWQHSHWQNFYRAAWHAADIERSAQLIRDIGGGAEPIYRPPVGLKSPELARAAHARQITLVAWSLHSRDTFSRNPQGVAQRVLSRIKPGDIVLLHDGHEMADRHRRTGAQALPLILRGLQERGLRSVTVSKLLAPTAH